MMKIKILYVIDNLTFGGGERNFVQVAGNIDKKEFEVYFACFPGGLLEEYLKVAAIQIISIDLSKQVNFKIVSKLIRVIKDKKIDIVHSQGARADFYARIASKRAGVKAVVSTIAMPVEGFDVGIIKKMFYILADRITERLVDRFIVVSDALKERLVKVHKIGRDRITKIYNGIEIEHYRFDNVAGESFKREFNLSQGRPIVVTIGRLVWQKGIEYFLQAAEKVLRVIPEVKFIIVGEGNLKYQLEKLANTLGLKGKVIFTGFRKDIKEILSATDIFVLPSIREGQPIVLLEAMAMARPIVATNIDGIDETIINDKSGILVQPGDSNALSEAVISLLRDKEKAHHLGLEGRRIVENEFDLSKIIKQYEKTYVDLMG